MQASRAKGAALDRRASVGPESARLLSSHGQKPTWWNNTAPYRPRSDTGPGSCALSLGTPTRPACAAFLKLVASGLILPPNWGDPSPAHPHSRACAHLTSPREIPPGTAQPGCTEGRGLRCPAGPTSAPGGFCTEDSPSVTPTALGCFFLPRTSGKREQVCYQRRKTAKGDAGQRRPQGSPWAPAWRCGQMPRLSQRAQATPGRPEGKARSPGSALCPSLSSEHSLKATTLNPEGQCDYIHTYSHNDIPQSVRSQRTARAPSLESRAMGHTEQG